MKTRWVRESGRKRFSTDIVLIVTDGESVEYGERDLTDAVLTPDRPQVPLHVKKRTLLLYHDQRSGPVGRAEMG